MYKFFLIIFLTTSSLFSQQVLDSSNVLIVDNEVCDGLCNEENYKEFGTIAPWTFNDIYSYNNFYRMLPPSGPGTHREVYVQYKFKIPADDYYILYMGSSSAFNRGRTYITIQSGEISIDSMAYYKPYVNPNLSTRFSWIPIGIYNLSQSDSLLIVERGLDSLSLNNLRTDAFALVRSSEEDPDLEFGSRPYSYTIIFGNSNDTIITDFYSQREKMAFPLTINQYSYYSEEKFYLYNYGTEQLSVSDVTFGTNLFTTPNKFPINILPGGKHELAVRFSPDEEGYLSDTLSIHSNDPLEPIANIHLVGTGINYNFILNASENGTEPHWNVPGESGIYEEVDTTWNNSTPSDAFPIEGGNKYSRVNISNEAEAFFSFMLLDSLEGNYFIDGSPFPFSSAQLLYKADIYTTTDTFNVFYDSHNFRPGEFNWCAIGDSDQTFHLSPGEVIIRFYEPFGGIMRLDLLRIKMAGIPTIIPEENPQIISNAFLHQNYPNPFNPTTKIQFDIPIQTIVKIALFDILGQEIKVLVNEMKNPGSYNINFDASDLPSGIYFYSLQYESKAITKKMILLK
jgi:hypothetical protein